MNYSLKIILRLLVLIMIPMFLLSSTPLIEVQGLSSTPLIEVPKASQTLSTYGQIVYPTPTPDSVTWLHTSGMNIYNSTGDRVNLYAANLIYGDGSGIRLSDIQNIKSLGFNAFRVFIHWKLMQPFNETLQGINQAYFTNSNAPLRTSFDQLINWSIQEKMYIILVIVWTETYTPPTWAFPSVQNEDQRFTALFDETAIKEKIGLTNCYNFLANRYKEVPNIIFEILNEPSVVDSSKAGIAYKSFNEDIITSMETAESNSHVKIVELLLLNPDWQEIVNTALDVNKPNVAWATHNYAPMSNWDPNGRYYHSAFTGMDNIYRQVLVTALLMWHGD